MISDEAVARLQTIVWSDGRYEIIREIGRGGMGLVYEAFDRELSRKIAGLAAGWFARKVHSIPAGIAFGLGVGALLAYGIVAAQGGKYFWQIMLPGSCVGAIVGWATQQHGSRPQVPA